MNSVKKYKTVIYFIFVIKFNYYIKLTGTKNVIQLIKNSQNSIWIKHRKFTFFYDFSLNSYKYTVHKVMLQTACFLWFLILSDVLSTAESQACFIFVLMIIKILFFFQLRVLFNFEQVDHCWYFRHILKILQFNFNLNDILFFHI